MKNKKILIIIGIIGFLIILITVLFIVFKRNKTIVISFDTKGAEIIKSVSIEKGKSITLPSVSKEGYKFMGWYIGDIGITNETKFLEDTTIFAEWLDESIKTFKVTFDSDGGSYVNDLIVECGKTIKFGSNPTKTGFEFVSWIDSNETPILDGAKLECNDITLKANWKQDEIVEEKKESKKEETKKETKTEVSKQEEPKEEKQISYSCPDEQYTLDGTTCTLTKDAEYGCDIQYEKKYNDKCYSVRTYKEATCKIQDGSTGTGSSIQPILVDGIVIYKDSTTAYCAYERQSNLSNCNGFPERIINGSNCYKRVETRPTSNVCPNKYDYVIGNALYGTIEKGTSASTGCYQSSEEHYYCESDFTLKDNKCIKTIQATVS